MDIDRSGKMGEKKEQEKKQVFPIRKNLQENIRYIEDKLVNCNDIIKKEFHTGIDKDIKFYMVYTDGLTKTDMLEESVLAPLLKNFIKTENDIMAQFECSSIQTADMKEVSNMEEALTNILAGNTVLFVDGYDYAILISSKNFPTRGVQEADQEVVLRGPKDSFNESLRTNTALIRRRIRDTRLKVEQLQVGERSKTDIALMYMDDLVRPDVLQAVRDRLDKVSMDGILDGGMLEQLIEKNWKSPFPQFQSTQRPDKTASALLEGRVVLVVDNSPQVLILPVTFQIFFQASDDYYDRWEVASFARILRYMASFLAIGLPAFYIAIANFHTEILPTSLILSIAAAREGVPFPVVVEVLLMELSFELLREAGIRLPGQLGGTIGIVGGLIVGQAAVDAGLVSTIVVIVVSLTAIASFAVPNETFSSAFRMLKFLMIIFAACYGIYGFFLGWLLLFIHLAGLKSFCIPYMMPSVAGSLNSYEDGKDFHFRWPLFSMRRRPIFTREDARIRRKN
ncbi:MAG: spore germination protein [Lachnospiraceae bacterium]